MMTMSFLTRFSSFILSALIQFTSTLYVEQVNVLTEGFFNLPAFVFLC